MTPWQAFVFDFDGVLADSVEVKTRAFEALYLPHGPDVAARVVRHHREHGGMPRREKFRHYQAVFLGAAADEATLDRLCAAFSALVVDAVVAAPEIPGATGFLRAWHGRVPLFVDSATPDAELAVILKRRGLDGFFKSVYGSGDTKASNLAAILAHGGFDPSRVLFFGDAASDLRAAEACGVRFVGVARDAASPLRRAAPDLPLFEDFHGIQAHLEGASR